MQASQLFQKKLTRNTSAAHPSGPPNTRLRAYTGHPLKVHGQLIAHLKYQDQSADVPLLVVEGSGPSLFGRDWLSGIRLNWTKICNIRVSETDLPQGVASQLRTTIQNHPNVFKPGLGTVKGITAKLEMKPDAHPKFCKARPVPYALQEAVEAEYNRLEDRKVFRKVSGIDRELNICRIHVEEYHEPVFALSSRLFCHL